MAAEAVFPPLEHDDDFELVMSRVQPKYWRELFRALACAIRMEAHGPFVSRINLKGGHTSDWKIGLKHRGVPAKRQPLT